MRGGDMEVRVDLLNFEGRMNLNDFIECIQIVERIFKYKEVSSYRRVKLVAIKLKKNTSL